MEDLMDLYLENLLVREDLPEKTQEYVERKLEEAESNDKDPSPT